MKFEFIDTPSLLNRAPPHTAPLALSEEERHLQWEKINLIKYMVALLERIAWQTASGNLEFDEFRKFAKQYEQKEPLDHALQK